MNKDIKTLIKILNYKGEKALSLLLENSKSVVDGSGQYGSQANSIISTFIIYSSVENYYKLAKLDSEQKKILHASILELYPLRDGEPEIVDFDFRILRDDENQENKLSSGSVADRVGVGIFISYSSLDKVLAAQIKEILSEAGFNVFLAHEDITPSSEWIEVIIDNLRLSDIFIPLITENFRGSDWTAQESGYSLAMDQMIIPVSINNHMPYGFIGRFQALKLNPKNLGVEANKIIDLIIEKGQSSKFKHRMINRFLNLLGESNSWDTAGYRIAILTKFNDFDKDQVNNLFSLIVENDQIYNSFKASTDIYQLFKKYKEKINQDILDKLKVVKKLS